MQPLKRNCIALNQELQNPERSYKALKQRKKGKKKKKGKKFLSKKGNFFLTSSRSYKALKQGQQREKGKREKKILTP